MRSDGNPSQEEWKNFFNYHAGASFHPAEAGGWSEKGFRLRYELVKKLLNSTRSENHRVLDAGCGIGAYLDLLNQLNIPYPVGIDFSPIALRRARACGHTVIECDIRKLPFKTSFDLVLNIGVLQTFREPADAIRELVRVTVPRGRIFLLTLNGNSLRKHKRKFLGQPDVLNSYTKRYLVARFREEGCEIRRCGYLYILPPALEPIEQLFNQTPVLNPIFRAFAYSLWIEVEKIRS